MLSLSALHRENHSLLCLTGDSAAPAEIRPPVILVVGNDMDLLETRAAVLKRTGSIVRCASSAEADILLPEQCFDLLVLCHTLSPEQRGRFTSLARKLWRGIHIVQMITFVCDEDVAGRPADVRTSTCEPHSLVELTNSLLKVKTEQGGSSTRFRSQFGASGLN